MLSILQVILAAAASWLFGAVWYGIMGKRWMKAVGLTEEQVAKKDPLPFIVSFICALLVAGALRHLLVMSGLTGLWAGMSTGASVGIFFALPWIATNYLFAERDPNLIWIDGTYAVVGSALMGLVLSLW